MNNNTAEGKVYTRLMDAATIASNRNLLLDAANVIMKQAADIVEIGLTREQQQEEITRLTARNNLLDAANGGDRTLLTEVLRKVEAIKQDTYALTLRMRR